MSLKQFNEIISAEIERAHEFERNNLWKNARQVWLDICEYCLLFARKTPGLKTATAKMIITKAEKLMERVARIDEKIEAEQLAAVPEPPMPRHDAMPIMPAGQAMQPDHDLEARPSREDHDTDSRGPGPSADPTSRAGGDRGSKIIEVGDEDIAIPDDFPLIEITPKNSFKPASIPPEPTRIDSTKHPVDKDDKDDGTGPGNVR